MLIYHRTRSEMLLEFCARAIDEYLLRWEGIPSEANAPKLYVQRTGATWKVKVRLCTSIQPKTKQCGDTFSQDSSARADIEQQQMHSTNAVSLTLRTVCNVLDVRVQQSCMRASVRARGCVFTGMAVGV